MPKQGSFGIRSLRADAEGARVPMVPPGRPGAAIFTKHEQEMHSKCPANAIRLTRLLRFPPLHEWKLSAGDMADKSTAENA
jgi:hypothetical protein